MENIISTNTDYFSADEREHKDRFFKYLFGNPKYKEFALKLYNTLNGRNYTDPDLIDFNTIEESFFIHMRNDVSMIIDNEMHLWEQQSTWSPNMPLRELFYYCEIIKRKMRREAAGILHSNRHFVIEVPKLFVFYNGRSQKPKEEILRLADSYLPTPDGLEPIEPDIDVKVKMININYEEDDEFLNNCKPVKEYAFLVDQINQNTKSMDIHEAINSVLDNVPDDFEIKKAIEEGRDELEDMILAEFDEQRYAEIIREDARAEGLAEGRTEGKIEGINEGKEKRLNEILQYMIDSDFSEEDIEKIKRRFSVSD